MSLIISIESKHRLDILISERECFIAILSRFEEEIFDVMLVVQQKCASNKQQQKIAAPTTTTSFLASFSPTTKSGHKTIADEEFVKAARLFNTKPSSSHQQQHDVDHFNFASITRFLDSTAISRGIVTANKNKNNLSQERETPSAAVEELFPQKPSSRTTTPKKETKNPIFSSSNDDNEEQEEVHTERSTPIIPQITHELPTPCKQQQPEQQKNSSSTTTTTTTQTLMIAANKKENKKKLIMAAQQQQKSQRVKQLIADANNTIQSLRDLLKHCDGPHLVAEGCVAMALRLGIEERIIDMAFPPITTKTLLNTKTTAKTKICWKSLIDVLIGDLEGPPEKLILPTTTSLSVVNPTSIAVSIFLSSCLLFSKSIATNNNNNKHFENEQQTLGIQRIRVCESGWWRDLIIDEWVPVVVVATAIAVGSEEHEANTTTTPTLLSESQAQFLKFYKALCKMKGSYVDDVATGDVFSRLEDLTGGFVVRLDEELLLSLSSAHHHETNHQQQHDFFFKLNEILKQHNNSTVLLGIRQEEVTDDAEELSRLLKKYSSQLFANQTLIFKGVDIDNSNNAMMVKLKSFGNGIIEPEVDRTVLLSVPIEDACRLFDRCGVLFERNKKQNNNSNAVAREEQEDIRVRGEFIEGSPSVSFEILVEEKEEQEDEDGTSSCDGNVDRFIDFSFGLFQQHHQNHQESQQTLMPISLRVYEEIEVSSENSKFVLVQNVTSAKSLLLQNETDNKILPTKSESSPSSSSSATFIEARNVGIHQFRVETTRSEQQQENEKEKKKKKKVKTRRRFLVVPFLYLSSNSQSSSNTFPSTTTQKVSYILSSSFSSQQNDSVGVKFNLLRLDPLLTVFDLYDDFTLWKTVLYREDDVNSEVPSFTSTICATQWISSSKEENEGKTIQVKLSDKFPFVTSSSSSKLMKKTKEQKQKQEQQKLLKPKNSFLLQQRLFVASRNSDVHDNAEDDNDDTLLSSGGSSHGGGLSSSLTPSSGGGRGALLGATGLYFQSFSNLAHNNQIRVTADRFKNNNFNSGRKNVQQQQNRQEQQQQQQHVINYQNTKRLMESVDKLVAIEGVVATCKREERGDVIDFTFPPMEISLVGKAASATSSPEIFQNLIWLNQKQQREVAITKTAKRSASSPSSTYSCCLIDFGLQYDICTDVIASMIVALMTKSKSDAFLKRLFCVSTNHIEEEEGEDDEEEEAEQIQEEKANTQQNKLFVRQGYYRVRLLQEGWWQDMILDTWLPYRTSTSTSNDEEIIQPAFVSTTSTTKKLRLWWIPLLQKALAKSCGSFNQLLSLENNNNMMYLLETVFGTTTSPSIDWTQDLMIMKKNNNNRILFQKIQGALRLNHLVVVVFKNKFSSASSLISSRVAIIDHARDTHVGRTTNDSNSSKTQEHRHFIRLAFPFSTSAELIRDGGVCIGKQDDDDPTTREWNEVLQYDDDSEEENENDFFTISNKQRIWVKFGSGSGDFLDENLVERMIYCPFSQTSSSSSNIMMNNIVESPTIGLANNSSSSSSPTLSSTMFLLNAAAASSTQTFASSSQNNTSSSSSTMSIRIQRNNIRLAPLESLQTNILRIRSNKPHSINMSIRVVKNNINNNCDLVFRLWVLDTVLSHRTLVEGKIKSDNNNKTIHLKAMLTKRVCFLGVQREQNNNNNNSDAQLSLFPSLVVTIHNIRPDSFISSPTNNTSSEEDFLAIETLECNNINDDDSAGGTKMIFTPIQPYSSQEAKQLFGSGGESVLLSPSSEALQAPNTATLFQVEQQQEQQVISTFSSDVIFIDSKVF